MKCCAIRKLNKFIRDRRGVTALATGISFFVLAGFAGTAIDVSAWLGAKTSVQNAADQAVYSAVVGVNAGGSGYTNAFAILAQSGYACTSNSYSECGRLCQLYPYGQRDRLVNSPTGKRQLHRRQHCLGIAQLGQVGSVDAAGWCGCAAQRGAPRRPGGAAETLREFCNNSAKTRRRSCAAFQDRREN